MSTSGKEPAGPDPLAFLVAAFEAAASPEAPWPPGAVEDLTAVIVLRLGVDRADLDAEGQASIARFLRRTGLDTEATPETLSQRARDYFTAHPIPDALVAELGRVARSALIEKAGSSASITRRLVGSGEMLRPVQGSASDAGSLLQLRLRGGTGSPR
ncbi:MAG: hypothetical protein IT384_22485 [Deltaproteobacteria bacterium]|nr:hypothetical protein [Deltaproteobacteria bacterium]